VATTSIHGNTNKPADSIPSTQPTAAQDDQWQPPGRDSLLYCVHVQ
jgi:hypothetical protein